MNKTLKMPSVSLQTKLLSFDLETNGLHGKAFAVGAVVMDAQGNVLEEFSARCRLSEKTDDWVKDNVLPAIAEMPITHTNYTELREAFWEWYTKTEPEVDYVLVNNGYPVEYRFLLDCQQANLEERYWQHPFPILELSSLLLMADRSGASFKRQLDANYGHKLHHPLEDAKLACKIAFETFRMTGRLK